MTEVYEHNPGDHEDPVSGATWMVGFLGAVLLIVIVLGLTALYYNAEHQQQVQKVVEPTPLELLELREAQHAVLTAPPHFKEVDEGAPVKRVTALVIPLDEAIQLTIRDEQAGAKK